MRHDLGTPSTAERHDLHPVYRIRAALTHVALLNDVLPDQFPAVFADLPRTMAFINSLPLADRLQIPRSDENTLEAARRMVLRDLHVIRVDLPASVEQTNRLRPASPPTVR